MAPPTHPTLRRLHGLDTSSPDFRDQLDKALHGQEYRRCVSNIEGDDLKWLVNYLDEVLGRLDLSSPVSRKCLRELRNICSTSTILPTSYTLSTDHLGIDLGSFATGGYADMYRGTLNDSGICIKRIRIHSSDDEQATKVFCQEAVIWKYLKHPNILSLLGVTTSPLQLISGWMSGGNLQEYIKNNSNADRLELLCEVANGLCYLHSCNVIHGSIRGPNILVDDSGHIRIADFGDATIVKDQDSVEDDLNGLPPSTRWDAPEVIDGGPHSKESDVFSFAMVMTEVFTGATPFNDRSSPMAMFAITQGKRPQRPKHSTVTGRLWKLIQHCWGQDPRSRPEAVKVLEELLACNPPAWKKLTGHKVPTEERIPLIKSIFSDHDMIEVFEYFSRDDAQAFVDAMDEILDTLPQQIYRSCLRHLYRICGHQVLLPKSLQIPPCYNPADPANYRGGFADVWKSQHNGLYVAAKALRIYSSRNLEKTRKRFCREVMTWRTLSHPNVLPLLGVTMTENQFVMVSEWMDHGNINEFLKKSDTNVDRLQLLREITAGLVYMHDRGVIHGDLKGDNIMIDKDGHARLADFSLITLIPDQSTFVSTCIEGGTFLWMSPELLDPESFNLKGIRLTKESDCYALGMVIYEILSGQVPFGKRGGPFVALSKVLCGERPPRPQGEAGKLFTDDIWEVVELCWKPRPSDRAIANDVLECLGGTPPPSRPPFKIDRDADTDSDDQSDAASDDS